MKTYCFECKHDCHCDRKCDHCSCYTCNDIVIKNHEDYLGENMFKKIWKKIETIIENIKNLWNKFVAWLFKGY
jgi:hypothetical protein